MSKTAPRPAPRRPAGALPQIPVDIGRPENCQYPVETAADFDYRIIQRNNRSRRISNGGV